MCRLRDVPLAVSSFRCLECSFEEHKTPSLGKRKDVQGKTQLTMISLSAEHYCRDASANKNLPECVAIVTKLKKEHFKK